MSQPTEAPKSLMQKILDVVEKVGNKIPHPVVLFLILIAIVMVLSHVFYLTGTSVTAEVIAPEETITPRSPDYYPYPEDLSQPHHPETKTIAVRSLLTMEGIRFLYESVIPNFMSFTGLGLIIVAMVGVGVAEQSGLVKGLIRK